jgi:hypothetical protein
VNRRVKLEDVRVKRGVILSFRVLWIWEMKCKDLIFRVYGLWVLPVLWNYRDYRSIFGKWRRLVSFSFLWSWERETAVTVKSRHKPYNCYQTGFAVWCTNGLNQA